MTDHVSFPVLKNDRLIRAAFGEEIDEVPVWIMRQAGRYLPEFREVRSEVDFFTICRTPELACKVTLQPIDRFQLDAAIIFSDILVIPQALGMEVEMRPAEGPVFPAPLMHPDDVSHLSSPAEALPRLQYVFDAISLTRHKLAGRVPLIGFCGAPWTIMSYMIEGKGSKTCSLSKSWLYKFPEESDKLLHLIAKVSVDYLVGQVKAGAQMLQVFESHAEHLGPETFGKFALPYLSLICDDVKKKVKQLGLGNIPMTVFAKGGHFALQDLAALNYDVIGIDWTVDPVIARQIIGPNKTLQGNMDPCALYGDKDSLESCVKQMVAKFGNQRYIANLGHGIYPDMSPEKVSVFVDAVHKFTKTGN